MPSHIKRNGFTIIELLIAISLVIILSGIVLMIINPQALQNKARDSEKISALRTMKTAIDLYYAENKSFPCVDIGCSQNWIDLNGENDPLSVALIEDYLNSLPVYTYEANPESCGSKTLNGFHYKSNGSKYIITAQMENESSVEGLSCTSSPVYACAGTEYCVSFSGEAL